MNVKSIEKEGSKAKVVVEVEAELLESGKQKAYLKARKDIMVPGFRKGKCPRQMIEAMYGADVFTEDGINEIFPEVYAGTVLKEENLKPVGMPTVVDMQFPEAGGVELTVETELYPEVTLGDYKGLEVPKAEATVSDDEIAAELNRMAENVARVTTVERAAKDGDFVMIKLASTADGASVDALTNESRLVEIGGPMMPQELTEQLVGMKAGDEKEFDFTTEFDPSLAGKTIHTTVTVKEVREKETPELDDEFAKKVGFDTFDELVEQLKSEITSTKAEQLPRLKESRCVTELSRRIKGDIPDAYLDYTRENILRDFFNSLQEQGTTFDQFLSSRGITGEQFREDLEAQSREEAEECLALDALFTHLDMSIGEEDIEKEFSVANNPEATRKAWEDAGRMSIIREAIRRQRATKWLVDNAVVTIDNGTDDEA